MMDGIKRFSIKVVLSPFALLIGVLRACLVLFEPLYDLWTEYKRFEIKD